MRTNLICNRDMLVMDIQEKTKENQQEEKIWIVNVYNQQDSGRILDKVSWDSLYKDNMKAAGDMNTHSAKQNNNWKKLMVRTKEQKEYKYSDQRYNTI